LLTHVKTVVIPGLKNNYGLATDKREVKIYFVNGSSISRANLDGTGVEVFLQNVEVFTMDFDWTRRRLFWVSNSNWRTYVTYLESQEKTELAKAGLWNDDIAVDPTVG
jgi:phosphatidate phosphatase APP1